MFVKGFLQLMGRLEAQKQAQAVSFAGSMDGAGAGSNH
jgi:hypothetical protein